MHQNVSLYCYLRAKRVQKTWKIRQNAAVLKVLYCYDVCNFDLTRKKAKKYLVEKIVKPQDFQFKKLKIRHFWIGMQNEWLRHEQEFPGSSSRTHSCKRVIWKKRIYGASLLHKSFLIASSKNVNCFVEEEDEGKKKEKIVIFLK